MNQQIITVSFEDFLRTGNFGEIRFGMTSNQILNLLGDPDFIFSKKKFKKPTGFEYGDVELYFLNKENTLSSIYMEHFEVPKGNDFLKIDAWGLYSSMSQFDVEKKLKTAKIEFQLKMMNDSSMRGVITEGGVELGFIFETDDTTQSKGLYSIGIESNEKIF